MQEKYKQRRQQAEEEYRRKREEWEANRPKKPVELKISAPKASENKMIEIVVNDRMGQKVRVKCMPDDTIADLKRLVGEHTGTRADKIRLQKQHTVYKDQITVDDYEIKDGMMIEMYYN